MLETVQGASSEVGDKSYVLLTGVIVVYAVLQGIAAGSMQIFSGKRASMFVI